MSALQKPLLRLAVAIHSRLAREGQLRIPAWPYWKCEEGERIDRQLRRAERLGLHLAAAQLKVELRHATGTLGAELAELLNQLPLVPGHAPTATLNDVYQDLLALDEEFDALSYDIAEHSLSITTEPIQLEGVYLGPFEICLNWGQSAGDVSYRVIALEPHPSAPRENVTHPHVMDEVLCEGHGRSAIRTALAQGRLYDFFTLVAGVLRTFNPESPFVALCEWYGHECSDCGTTMHEDERYVCARCGDALCGECEITCDSCSEGFCADCAVRCKECDLYCCNKCMKRCAACAEALCLDCFRKNERCTSCHEEERYPEEPADEDESGAAVHADGVGQAAVSA